jgi:hypothetical protein
LYDFWGETHTIHQLAVVAFRQQVERFTVGQVNRFGSQSIFSTTVIDSGVLAEFPTWHLAAYLLVIFFAALVIPLQ